MEFHQEHLLKASVEDTAKGKGGLCSARNKDSSSSIFGMDLHRVIPGNHPESYYDSTEEGAGTPYSPTLQAMFSGLHSENVLKYQYLQLWTFLCK